MARVQKWTLKAKTTTTGQTIGDVTVYGRTENWNFFFETPVTDELKPCTTGAIKSSKDVKTFNRRKHALDTVGYNVPGNRQMKLLTGVTRTSGNALPGKTLVLMTDPESWDGGEEKRSFQYVGAWRDLFLHMEDDAGKDIIAFNYSGAKYRICEETGDATVQGATGTDLVRAR